MVSGGLCQDKRSSLILGTSLVRLKVVLVGTVSLTKPEVTNLMIRSSLDVFEWNALRNGSHWRQKQFCLMTESEMAFSRVGISRPMLITYLAELL